MNTNPENPSNEIESNIQSGITRRSFIKRTAATAVVTALALHAFRNEARAEDMSSSGGVLGVYGIVIVIEGPVSGTYPATSATGNSGEMQGLAIRNALDGKPGVTVTKLEGRYAPWETAVTTVTPGNPAPPADPYYSVVTDPEGNVTEVNLNAPANKTIIITIIWGTPW